MPIPRALHAAEGATWGGPLLGGIAALTGPAIGLILVAGNAQALGLATRYRLYLGVACALGLATLIALARVTWPVPLVVLPAHLFGVVGVVALAERDRAGARRVGLPLRRAPTWLALALGAALAAIGLAGAAIVISWVGGSRA